MLALRNLFHSIVRSYKLIQVNGLAHFGTGSLATLIFSLALEPLLHFRLLTILSLLFLLAFLECLVTTSRQANLLF